MGEAAALTALAVATVNALAAAWGAWRWWRVEPSTAFWWLARAGQAASVAQVIVAGVLFARDFVPRDGLYWLYVALPVVVAFVGEQFRVAAAEAVLDARDLPDAPAVGRLPDEEQRSVVVAILRREMGVVSLASAVVVFLALRAYATVGS
jgi:hypothetical protein